MEVPSGFFFAILGRGPRAFQIGKISVVNHYIGKIAALFICALQYIFCAL